MMATWAAEAVSGSSVNMTAVIVAAIGAVGGFLSYMQASAVRREQRKMDNRKVDAEAYDRARKFDQEVVESLRAEIERLNVRLKDERERLEQERESATQLRQQLVVLDEFQGEVVSLRRALDSEKLVSQELRDQVVRLEGKIAQLMADVRSDIHDIDEGIDEDMDEDIIDGHGELFDEGPSY